MELDQAEPARPARDFSESGRAAVEELRPSGSEERWPADPLLDAQPDRERERARRWFDAAAQFPHPALEVAGLRPGTRGVSGNLVEHGLIETVTGAGADNFDERRANQFGADGEGQDGGDGGAQDGVAGQRSQQCKKGSSSALQKISISYLCIITPRGYNQ